MKLASSGAPISLILSIALIFSGMAAGESATSPEQLRALQSKVHDVAGRGLTATVSLFSEASESSGSGVIISRSGLILTAGHVVEGLEEVTVVFSDGKQAAGKVLGSNLSKDAAMVKLEGDLEWPFVELGDSRGVEVGDFVVSLGHAGGFDALRTPPVRFGRVVALNPLGFIGSDCALIGGDSGGPLFNLEGEVIAIHSSIGASLRANNHTGVQNFKADWERLINGETWGRLTMNPLMNPDRPVIGFNVAGAVEGGVRLGEVYPDSPADVAGIRQGDIVVSIDGKPVESLRGLQGILSGYEPGNEVELTFNREGESRTCSIKLARLADVMPEQK
ncbi:MAG: trypsin-like peptidase domain-containing protein [Roseibacillus sp.]|nr:trypsin-like peptidase domain-containing protein [Roseibacillus sp.]